MADLLLVLLVDCVEGIFDGDTFEVTCGDLKTQGEVEVDLLDWWGAEQLLEVLLVLYH